MIPTSGSPLGEPRKAKEVTKVATYFDIDFGTGEVVICTCEADDENVVRRNRLAAVAVVDASCSTSGGSCCLYHALATDLWCFGRLGGTEKLLDTVGMESVWAANLLLSRDVPVHHLEFLCPAGIDIVELCDAVGDRLELDGPSVPEMVIEYVVAEICR